MNPLIGRTEYTSPASFAQERMWFLAQLEPDTPRYHICLTARLGRRVDPRRLGRALATVCARHEALRTALTLRGDTLLQVVTAAAAGRLAVSDLSGIRSGSTRHEEFYRVARGDAAAPFTLDTAPLIRARLVRLNASDHRLVLVAHRAVADPVSAENLLRELLECDAALAARRPPLLPALATQYGDHAVSQRALLASGALDAQLEYWSTRLSDLPPDTGIPTDRPRRAHCGGAGAQVDLRLPTSTVKALAALARRRGTTLFTALLAGFKAVLQRYGGRSDVVVGWLSSGRCRPEFAPLIGAFENPLVLRTDLAGDPSFGKLLDRVHDTVQEGLNHAEIPFEKLVEAVPAGRDPSRHPLYQIGFSAPRALTFTPAASGEAAPPPSERIHSGTARLDLEVEVVLPAAGPPAILVEYASDLFDAGTARRLAAAYRTLLAAAAADPDSPLSELPVLPRSDTELIEAWNDTRRDYPATTVHDWILAQARSLPQAPAVCHEGTWWSYRQLADRAEETARRLRSAGTTAGDVVGVYLPGRPELPSTLLGVLATGAAYAQLEPELGTVRLRRLIAAAGIRLVLTTTTLADRLQRLPGVTVRCVDAGPEPAGSAAEREPAGPRPGSEPTDTRPADAGAGASTLVVPPDALACVVLAEPPVPGDEASCVGISHRAILNRLCWMQETLALDPSDRVLNATRCSFDASVWELFWPLLAGAGVVMAADEHRDDLDHLARLIDQERITVACFPANRLEPFLEVPELFGLDRVVCVGQPLSPQLAARCFERLPGVRLYHCSGPVEAAGGMAWHPCVPGERTIPTGRPVANTRFEILDDNLRRVPIGAVGQLCVGGAQVAQGYLGAPRSTAARFVADPYRRPGEVLLRTGARARWRTDGNVELVTGSTTPRGYLDPAHVRAELERHANVHRAEVTMPADASGGHRLVAYVQWTGNPDALADTLRRYLLLRLPRALVPAAFVAMNEFPATPDGGLDHAALPVPSVPLPVRPVTPPPASPLASLLASPPVPLRSERTRPGYVAPRTPVEQALCELWSELLGRRDIGVNCDFFELGGHSLLAARMISRIRQILGVRLALRRCFELSTVAEYALAVLDLQLQQAGYDIDDLVNALQAWEATP